MKPSSICRRSWQPIARGALVFALGPSSQAHGQSPVPYTRRVAVTSDPAGAMTWTKDGRNLVCTNTSTPGTIELEFHGDDDVRRILLRRFGFADKSLEIRPNDERVEVTLGEPTSFFATADNAPADLEKLNAGLKNEFQKMVLDDQEALRYAPLELDSIAVVKNEATGGVTLLANISLDRSFGGSAFRVAGRSLRNEQPQRMGAVALDSGIGEVVALLRHLTAGFPEVKVLQVTCAYSGTEVFLDSETVTLVAVSQTQETVNLSMGSWSLGPTGWNFVQIPVPVTRTETHYAPYQTEVTTMKDREVEKAIIFMIAGTDIPDTADMKVVNEAILQSGTIIVSRTRPK